MSFRRKSRAIAVAMLASCGSEAALSAPDQSCAGKFVGRWNWLNSTGIHTAHDFDASGSAPCSENGACVRGATWRCSGNDFYYNNGMGETKLTLSPDGRTMTGMGGFPSNLQTVTRLGAVPQGTMPGRTQASTRAEPPSAKPEVRYGDLYMVRGRKALRGSTAAAKRQAAHEFRGAAEFYAQASDPDRQRQAVVAADAADAEAERMERGRTASARRGREPPRCAEARNYMDQVAATGADVGQMRQSLAAQGCEVAP